MQLAYPNIIISGNEVIRLLEEKEAKKDKEELEKEERQKQREGK